VSGVLRARAACNAGRSDSGAQDRVNDLQSPAASPRWRRPLTPRRFWTKSGQPSPETGTLPKLTLRLKASIGRTRIAGESIIKHPEI
ncbi:MAG TPA: hypothetical protein VLZ81_11925, partial [Blastocatellia bacterium]|nr:hypothetical protein [Blastocatellia bacterium]